ncbi:thioesterase family protein [Pseudacidobacterium ailaaui]|jgi:acyl-CoA thioesterase FadM|uniref:thioesterase family protein n=1 Tax=Pseudacidobacterium ailaaui TaxID=1382359 RepID=UPI000678F70D|nr:thioesterase family protein [Pseudacidobacterium ailaaui]MDI3254684.1 thioesterase family protein [Bacillota bacterium]
MAHINSFVRIPLLTIRQLVRPLPRIGVLDQDRVSMRVLPNDIDFNFHLNNSRYLSCMDYGRIHMMAANGILNHALSGRWTPLVGSVDITYRRPLGLWVRFELHTRTLGWDQKWFYIEQSFHSDAGLAAIAWVKGLFRNRQGNIPPQTVVDMVAPGMTSPRLPEELERWNQLTKIRLEGPAAYGSTL